MERVLVAPNAFKGSLSAGQAAEAIVRGVRTFDPGLTCLARPVADGGDGSVAAFCSAGFSPVPVTVHGPTGEHVATSIALRDGVGVVELADACGMARLPGGVLAPLTSSTRGLGEAMLAALDAGATRLVVCLGGSASTDGGAGLLAALGVRLLDDAGHASPADGRSLNGITRIDVSGLDPRLLTVPITVAVDVTAPLSGEAGAARVFAPQKGATPAEVDQLDVGLAHWGRLLAGETGRAVAEVPGAGAAGGTAAALMAVLDADVVPGAELIADLLGLDEAINHCDLVITGEGRLDPQTQLGKGAAAVAARARSVGCPVVAVCGGIDLDAEEMIALGFSAWSDCLETARDEADAVSRADELVSLSTIRALQAFAAVDASD